MHAVNSKLRVVTQLPLRGLWTDDGAINAMRVRDLSSSNIRELLRASEVQFVVVDLGQKPRWIDLADCYRFWLDEAQYRIAEPDVDVALAQKSGVYTYRASEWESSEIKAPIVVLEVGH